MFYAIKKIKEMEQTQNVIELLNENAVVNAKVIFYRPPKMEDWEYNKYVFSQTDILANDNLYYRWFNRLSNRGWEFYTVELILPAKYFKEANRIKSY